MASPLAEMGEFLICAPRCSHCFHKECILEWLDKKVECPCCRKRMVTQAGLNAAAARVITMQRSGAAGTEIAQSNEGETE
ncbi:MAG: RING finger domain-containing protein [bacterium]